MKEELVATDAGVAERKAAAVEIQFKRIAITELREASYNPRRSFDGEALRELVESVREKGVLTPLLVRPIDGKAYEIVGGARRYRAAQQAGLKDVPCQVRALDDDEALEVAVIDNLQRADVSPLEEGRGYQELLKRGYKVEDLAKKIGKSVRYIYARLELGKLSTPVMKALDEGKITASHAQEIATLDNEEDQKRALESAFVETYDEGPEDAPPMVVEPDGDGYVKALVSVRDFKKTVSALKIGTALVEKLEALKLAGHKAALVTEDNWYSNKQVVSHGRWKLQGGTPCKFPAKGVLVDEKKQGRVIDICLTTSCKKHFATHPVSSAPKKPTRADKLSQIKAQLEAEARRAIADDIFRAFIGKSLGVLGREDLEQLAKTVSWNAERTDVLESMFPLFADYGSKREKQIEALKDKELAQLIRACVWQEHAEYRPYGGSKTSAGKAYLERARKLGVDVKGITKQGLEKLEERFQEEKGKLDATDKQTSTEPDDEESSEVEQVEKSKPAKKAKASPKKKAKASKAKSKKK